MFTGALQDSVGLYCATTLAHVPGLIVYQHGSQGMLMLGACALIALWQELQVS